MRNTLSERYARLYKRGAPKSERRESIQQYNFVNFINKEYLHGRGRTLLDVACGDGSLDRLLKKRYAVTGIDKDSRSISIARKRIPGVKFLTGDMQNFKHNGKFDIILCVHGLDHGHLLRRTMAKTIRNLGEKLGRPGAIVFDVNFLKELWERNGTITHTLKNRGELWTSVFYREVDGHTGVSYSTTILSRGNRVSEETSKTHRSTHLLDMDLIGKVGKRTDFSMAIYDGWTTRRLKEVGERAPVVTFIKR